MAWVKNRKPVAPTVHGMLIPTLPSNTLFVVRHICSALHRHTG